MGRSLLSHQQRSWLLGELDVWSAQGIISSDQVHRILDLYESPKDVAERHRNTLLFVLMGLAATLVGLAVILFFAFNWEAMPAVLKLVLIFGIVGGTHAGGFYLRFYKDARQLSEVLFLLGCLFYGAAIWLLAQIFHLNAHYPDGVWWWAIGVLPFALCLDTLLLHALVAILLATWVGVEIIGFPHLGGWLFGRWWAWFPNGAYTLPLLALPGMVWAYRKNSPATVALYAPVIAWWALLQPIAWHWNGNPIYLIGTVGGLFLIVAESHRASGAFARIYRLWGVLILAGVLLPLSFYNFNYHDMSPDDVAIGFAEAVGILLVTGVTVALGRMFQSREAEANPFADPVRAFTKRLWLPIGIPVLMAFLAAWGTLGSAFDTRPQFAVLPTLLANVAIIALALYLVRIGLREERGLPFAGGVVMFLVWMVMRYIDLFGDFGGMLGASCMFFFCGAALFGVALYWRKRKSAHEGVQ